MPVRSKVNRSSADSRELFATCRKELGLQQSPAEGTLCSQIDLRRAELKGNLADEKVAGENGARKNLGLAQVPAPGRMVRSRLRFATDQSGKIERKSLTSSSRCESYGDEVGESTF